VYSHSRCILHPAESGRRMNNRLVQLALVAFVGAFLAWWLMRDDEPEPVTPPTVSRAAPTSPGVAAEEPAHSDPPPKVTFKVPKMASAKAGAEGEPPKPKPSGKIQIPREWLLRGSASKNYELRSDRDIVFSGNYSAVLIAHDKDVSPNLSGSGI